MFTIRTAGRAIIVGVVIGAAVAAVPASATSAMSSTASSASAGDGFVYVTNRDSNSVSVFAVDRTGRPVPTHPPVETGAGPRGIVFAPDGATAYVVNTGANAVSVYAVDEDGGLRPRSAPVAADGESPFGIAIAPSGKSLYTSNVISGTLSAFTINADGTLRRVGDPVDSGADNPRGLAISPDGRFLFVGHGLPNAAATDVVTAFAIRGDGTLRRFGDPVPSGGAGLGMVTSPNGRFLYVVSTNTDAVYGYTIGRTGELNPIPGSPFPVVDFPEGAAITPDGRYLYVTSPGTDRANPDQAVTALTVAADGTLTPVAGSPFAAGDGPVGIAASADGRRLYVANLDAASLSAFTITPTGALRNILHTPAPTGGQGPAFQSVAVLPTHT